MGIELLSPAFLAGLLAVGVPIAIHLIHRRQSRVLPIATLRFLRLIPARTIRKRRLEEYVLLAARMLLLALLALAAARPVLRDATAAGGATSVVVVMDDSASMQVRAAGITRFQEGTQAALAVLRTLKEGDRAAFLLASEPAAAALAQDLPGVIRRAGAARPSPLAPDLLPAARAGLALLREATEPNRELVLVTDVQDRAVKPLLDGLRDEPGDESIRVVLVDVGAPAPSNAGITKVTAGSGALVAGETVPVTVEVRAAAAGRTTRISLVVGEERVAETTVILGPGEARTVTLEAQTEIPGAEGGRVYLDGDDLLADDVRYFTMPVAGRIPVLLVNGDPSPQAFQDEAFFLRAALAPEELGARSVASPVALKTIPAEALGREDLGTYRAVILANVPSLGPREATRLRSFVLGGGGLLLFMGSRVRPDEWNRDLGTDPEQGLLPAVLSAPEQQGDAEFGLASADRDHALFAGLPPEALKELDRIRVRRAMGADAKAAGGRVIAQLARGPPLIVEKTRGRGRVLLVNTSADRDWGNLPVRPIFLPLLHRAVRLLASEGDGTDDHVLGSIVGIRPPPPDAPPPEVTDPAGVVSRPVRENVAGELEFGPLLLPGIYRVKTNGGLRLFSANPDPRESDLSRGSVDALADRFGPARFRVTTAGEALAADLARTRRGRPLWGYLLGAALLLLLAEAFFANRIALARAATPAGEAAE